MSIPVAIALWRSLHFAGARSIRASFASSTTPAPAATPATPLRLAVNSRLIGGVACRRLRARRLGRAVAMSGRIVARMIGACAIVWPVAVPILRLTAAVTVVVAIAVPVLRSVAVPITVAIAARTAVTAMMTA